MPAEAGQLGGQHEQVGRVAQRREGPVEGEGEREPLDGVGAVGLLEHPVLEAEQHPGVDLERQVKVERAAAGVLGVQVDLPRLAQRVRLDEVALVVHVEGVVDGVVLEVGDEAGDVDDGQVVALPRTGAGRASLPRDRPGGYRARVDDRSLLEVLDATAAAVRAALGDLDDWGLAGTRAGQYRSDLAADAAALDVLARGRSRGAVGGVGTAPARGVGHGGAGPARRVDQRQPGHPLVRHQPVRRRRRGTTGRAGGEPGVGDEVRGGAGRGRPRRRGSAAPLRVPVAARGGRRPVRVPEALAGLEAVPGARGVRPRPVRGRRGRRRRLRGLLVERPRLLGLPGWAAGLPGGGRASWSTPTGGTWSPSSTPIAGPRSPGPRRRCSRSCVRPGGP